VKDTGIGVKKEEQEIIFDRFRQVDEDYSRSSSGTGMGLYICKTLMRQLNGQIWIESAPGKGTSFYFSLPL
jgi:signal transduction histidine kinase